MFKGKFYYDQVIKKAESFKFVFLQTKDTLQQLNFIFKTDNYKDIM